MTRNDHDPLITPATIADCTAIASLNGNVLVTTYAGVTPELTEDVLRHHTDSDWFLAKVAYYRDRLRAGDPLFVAKIGKQCVGFAMAGRDSGLYVSPEFHGSTVALRLLEDVAKGIEKSGIEKIVFTAVIGTAALRFYQKIGCKPTGRDLAAELPTLRSGHILPSIEMEVDTGAIRNAKERVDNILARRQTLRNSA